MEKKREASTKDVPILLTFGFLCVYMSNRDNNAGKNNDHSQLLGSAYCNSYFSKLFYMLTQFVFGQLNDERTAIPILQPRKLRHRQFKIICSRVHSLSLCFICKMEIVMVLSL